MPADTLGLGYNDAGGPVRRIADGADLAQRALEAFPQRVSQADSKHTQLQRR